jgi:RHS repeat-associated protein
MPVAATDQSGRLIFRGQTGLSGRLHRREGDGSILPFRFAGQTFDSETGLHYNRFRYYDSDLGTYTSPDPLGVVGGVHLWDYVGCPFTQIDPVGLKRLCANEARKVANDIISDARNGKVKKSTGYHGDTEHGFTDARVQDILANPDAVYHGTGKNSEIIFQQGGDIVVVRPTGSTKGVFTAYGPSGVVGPGHGARTGVPANTPGNPITRQDIEHGTIPSSHGNIPPANPIMDGSQGSLPFATSAPPGAGAAAPGAGAPAAPPSGGTPSPAPGGGGGEQMPLPGF